jgi:hypothetical protein
MPVTSTTQAPSRIPPPVSIAEAQQWSGTRSTMPWIRASTGNPKENHIPRSRHAAAKAWVAPAESERATTRAEPGSPGFGRACSGNAANA